MLKLEGTKASDVIEEVATNVPDYVRDLWDSVGPIDAKTYDQIFDIDFGGNASHMAENLDITFDLLVKAKNWLTKYRP
ncbi:MAG: hypothetical protein V1838_04605 [Patescibacteria group bacterium]